VIEETERRRMRWLILGFAVGGALFLIAALPLLFFDDPIANIPALVLLMVAPTVIMVCMALGVLYRGPADAGELLTQVPGGAALALVVVFVFALLLTVLTSIAEQVGISRTLAALAAVIITAVSYEPLRRATARAVNRILERPQPEALS
jgi:FtsH-binding integral membrane protein